MTLKQSHVSKASYPISKPLALILNAVINPSENSSNDENSHLIIHKETLESGFEKLIRNAIVAIDNLFFSTDSYYRNADYFRHRLVLRIATNEQDNTLTITDLGSGMTRADLINSLGIGSRLSATALVSARKLDVTEDFKDDTDDHSSSSSTSDSSSFDSGSFENEIQSSGVEACKTSVPHNSIDVHAMAEDIGGFYSALVALGTKIEIGTKSKFDDYYVFNIPSISDDVDTLRNTTSSQDANPFSKFSIFRPMDEGSKPNTENGFNSFTDVRGESGTRVTITLNQMAIDAGFLKEEEVLKPLLEKILETSPYTAVLEKCCTDEEVADFIDANRREEHSTSLDEKANQDFENEVQVDTELQTDDNQDRESYNSMKERSKYIPLRLSMGERKMLRLVEACMSCIEYTTEIDKPYKSTARRTHAQLKHITAVLRGMVSACDYSAGKKLLESDNYSDFQLFFRQMFEIARRHKIMNPEKMRTEYGKLIYLLQDAVSPSIQPHLSFSCKGSIETVYKYLEERNGLALLDDKLIDVATREVLAGKKTRAQIDNEIRRKERAVAHLKQHYCSSNLSSDDIHLCLYSICDNDSFLNSNRVPIDKVIDYLQQFFSPNEIEENYSLSIVSGQDGSRLSHSHERQYHFALQSLLLWREIVDDMFRLWSMAEEDLLNSESITYTLQNTGQGYQRIQQSPKTYKAMQKILVRVQGKVNQWIGSNVIHLGDHNVPNALTFIDKYNQVPRILGPIVSCLENIERICEEDDGIKKFIDEGFGGCEQLKKDILYDFFKSAFDGSGADNFYDAGSCIDGRLTSAWNWCSQLQEKPFYSIFKLTGFTGFDGEFK